MPPPDLAAERLACVGQRIDGTDLRADLAGVDELSDLDELGAGSGRE